MTTDVRAKHLYDAETILDILLATEVRAYCIEHIAKALAEAEARGRAEVTARVEAVAALMGTWRTEDSFVSDPEGITRMWRDFLRDEIRTLAGTETEA